ncbi:ORF6N domain-containing protein, partial [Escherichia coli]|nr:ORF6N domain-containing protein [Escherichia coli]
MKTISVESLSIISFSNIPVVTTELLASLYGTEPDYIRKNFNRNSGRFVIGKHYFLLENEELREFKHSMSLRPSVKIARNVRSLILWTERGAARHAKMLETDRAWEVFEKLEDCYFSQKIPEQLQLPESTLSINYPLSWFS